MEKPVPKFSSFRSKAAAPKEPQNSDEISFKNQDQQDRGHKRRHKLESHKQSKNANIPKQAHRGAEATQEVYEPENLSEHNDNHNIFVIDRKGDSGNLTYGRNAKHSVPEYRAPSKKHPLGDSGFRNNDSSSTKSILSRRNRELELTLRGQGEYVARQTEPESDRDALSEDFLPFGPTKKRKHSNNTHPIHKSLAETSQNLEHRKEESGQRESQSSASGTSESEDEGEGVSEPDARSFQIRELHASLSRQIKQHPQKVQAWLHFIEFQDQWVRQTLEQERADSTSAEKRSVAEVRLSLYQEALKNIKFGQNGYEILLLGFLNEGAKVWETKKLLAQWESLTGDHPDCLDIQSKYIDILQTRLYFFTYEKCLSQCSAYLNILTNNKKLSDDEKAERQLYTLLRLLSMMRDAGFKEHSRCLWQAIIEINLFSPPDHEKDFEQRLSQFEKFWDSELIRVGEEGASGWGHALQNSQMPQDSRSRPSSDPFLNKCDSQGNLTSWTKKETEITSMSFQPGRTTDEPEDNDDPFRIVLFADIRPFLFNIQQEYHTALVDAFLCFHQLPSLPGRESYGRNNWWHNPLLAKADYGNLSALDVLDVKRVLTTSDTLFSVLQPTFLSHLATKHDPESSEIRQFVANVLSALVKSPTASAAIQEYYLSFNAARDITKANKSAKTMLKENSSSLPLYNAYGQIELLQGNEKVGNHVFSIAIKQGLSFDNELDRLDVLLLQRTWVWQGLLQNSVATAIDRFENKRHLTDVLTALQTSRDAAIRCSLPKNAALASELLALGSYLHSPSSPTNLAAALETFGSETSILATLSTVESSAYAVEHLHQAQATLIAYHMQYQSLFSPALVRSALRSSIASFPSNTMFLDLYAENERRFHIDDRVRQVTNDILRAGERSTFDAQQSIVPWCFAIKTELERGKLAASGATEHSIRAAFERAVNSENADDIRSGRVAGPGPRSSSIIWTAYLRWEVEIASLPNANGRLRARSEKRERKRDRYGEKKGDAGVDDAVERKLLLQKARAVWLRGLNALPWVKEFVLLGLRLLRECLSDEDVRGYANMMEDKGLRVHYHFDEVGVE